MQSLCGVFAPTDPVWRCDKLIALRWQDTTSEDKSECWVATLKQHGGGWGGGGFVPGNFKLNDAEAEGVEMIETDLRRMS